MISRRKIVQTAVTSFLPYGCLDAAYGEKRFRPTGSRLGLFPSGIELLKDNAPFRAIGVNFYDAVNHIDLSTDFKILASKGVPFVRFNAGEYGAGKNSSSEWRLYLTDREAWYAQIDKVVAAAEASNVGLIPSMFWRYETLPDLMAYTNAGVRDALDQWGVYGSNTRAFFRNYTAEFVKRYAQSAAIWGWEFGNEFMSHIDRYPEAPPPGGVSGGPAVYLNSITVHQAKGASDIERFADANAAVREWNEIVKASDPHGRFTSTGLSVSDVAAYGGSTQTSAGPDRYLEWMGANGPSTAGLPYPAFENASTDVISAHIYQDARTPFWWFNDGGKLSVKPEGLIALCKSIADRQRKPFFLGEWGALRGQANTPSGEMEIAQFKSTLRAVIQTQVRLSAIWNYGYVAGGAVSKWNIDPNTPREYQLNTVAQANIDLRRA